MKVIGRALLGLLVVIVLILIYGLIEPYWLHMNEEEVVIPNLPEAFSGREVMAVADFQLGMFMDNEETVQNAVDEMIEARPSAVLLVGDFIYHASDNRANEAQNAANFVAPLVEAGIPTFAVLGNHDYSVTSREDPQMVSEQVEDLITNLEAVGVDVLENEAAVIETGGSQLYLVGVGSWMAHQANAEAALSGVPDGAARIVFMHNPEAFKTLPPNSAPLTVAGHTHCGQVRIPGLPTWSWIEFAEETDEETAHADGWIEEGYGAPGNRLYVTCGIGFSLAPIRINARPEVTVFRLLGD